ncbi:TonB family protein [Fluviicola sp.]|uniref:energy transducer TonB n=1 Tax=Fluviicola sp. TaxID=1917219 RepID=UPI0031CFDAAF
MKSQIHLLFLLAAFLLPVAVSAQSKKVMNQQLKSELAHQVAVYDSMQTSLLSKQKQLNTLREEALGDAKFSVKFKNKETEIRTILLRNHRLLKELNFDANTVCNLNETLKVPAPKAVVSYDKNSDLQKQKFQLAAMDSIRDLTDVKLKAQNELLKQQVAQYDSVNKLNGAVLTDMQGVIDQITNIREEYAAYFKSYQEFNNDLATKSDLLATKFFEVRKQRMREEAIEREKETAEEMKEMERRRKKNPNQLIFLPPMIEERSVYEEIGEPAFIPKEDRMVFRDPRSIPELREKQPVVLDVVEEPAEFPGGMAALKKYLSENMNYPKAAEENGIEGKVFLKFKVMETGKIQDVKVARGISGCPECDQEAIRLAENMPLWKPGKLNGKPISMYYSLPITFKLR